MKRVFMATVVCIVSAILKPSTVKAQAAEIQQLLLDVQKLSALNGILNDMYKGYEVVSNGYEAIKNISEGNFNLHEAFLNRLLAVSPTVQHYKRIADIINDQLMIIKEYKTAYTRFKEDESFTPNEIIYIGKVYSNLFNESLKGLDELMMLITASTLRMNDDERISSIDRIYEDMQDKLTFLRYFNNTTSVLEVQRAKEKNDATTMQGVYGVKP
jgi:hypothetical protein